MLSRRSFLAKSTALASGLSLGAWPGSAAEPRVWGDLPTGFFPGGNPGKPSYKVLEIHLYGGLSPWETFYVRPERGWRGFDAKIARAQWSQVGGDSLCRFAPGGALLTKPFDTSDPSHPIHLGPATAPLWDESILQRMRVVVLQHDLEPHEAAIPYAATGLRLGRPQMAGMGSAVQKRRNELDRRLPESQRRSTPTSFVCQPANAFGDNLQAFWSTGQLGERPLVLRIGGSNTFVERLARETVQENGTTEQVDHLLAAYRDAYKGLLTPPAGSPIRSRGYGEYETALNMLVNAKSLQRLLAGDASGPFKDLFADSKDPRCVTIPPDAVGEATTNKPRMALLVAAALLKPPRDADYACVIDNGLSSLGDGTGYDTHGSRHLETTFPNLYNLLAALRSLIDTGAIDLANTLVMLNTEFGRTPFVSSGGQEDRTSDGRDHWPQGYVSVLIGGPVAPLDAGSKARVLGRIGDGSADGGNGHAAVFYSATDLRAAAVLAAGFEPFTGDYINQGDLSTAIFKANDTHEATLTRLRSTFFGI